MDGKRQPAMLAAVFEEPNLVEICCGRERGRLTGKFADLISARPLRRIYFCGSGSVANTGMILKQAAEKWLGVEASWEYSGLFLNHGGLNASGKYRPEEMLVICPSESGLTRGPVEIVKQARSLGIPCVCTVQSGGSPLERYCDVVIVKPSGKELALPSTKGYSVGLLVLLLCLLEGARVKGTVSQAEYGHKPKPRVAGRQLSINCRSDGEMVSATAISSHEAAVLQNHRVRRELWHSGRGRLENDGIPQADDSGL